MTEKKLPQLIEHQLKEKAIEYDKFLVRGLHEHLSILKEMYEEKLYLYLGFQTLEEYCKDRLNIAKSTMYGYLQVARKFLPLAKIDENPISPCHGLIGFGVEKLTILASLEKTILSELIAKGVIKLRLKTYKITDFKKMTAADLRQLISGKTKTIKEDNDTIPFQKVYNQTEKYFAKIVNDIYCCPTIKEPDANQIEILIKRAALIFDKYKKDEEIMKKIL